MRIGIGGVPCTFVGVFKMAEEELKESQQTQLGFPRNQAVFGSRRKEKAHPADLPHYADPFLFILLCVNSSHSARLFPLVLNVITNFRSFATGVWHKLLRA